MNPNLEYAQMIPGHHNNKGRCYGVIDTYSFVEMLDAVQLLEKSKAFTPKDSKQLKAWFGKLLTWILNSPQGQEEANQANNHSTAHDAQVIAFALYAGNVKVAQEVINAIPQRRIFTQIEPDGRQPHELRRTLAFGYSQFNLSHFIDIFLMAQKIGISIDNATSTDGRNFYKAMDFLAPYVGKDVKDWPYQQISEWDYKQQEFCKDLYRVFLLNPERTDYLKLYRAHRTIDWKDRFNLLWVKPDDVDNAYAFACGQLQFAMKCANKARKEAENQCKHRVIPRSINKDGSLRMIHPHDWCSGFFTGSFDLTTSLGFTVSFFGSSVLGFRVTVSSSVCVNKSCSEGSSGAVSAGAAASSSMISTSTREGSSKPLAASTFPIITGTPPASSSG